MGNDSTPRQLTSSGATQFGSVFVHAICINRTLTGTLTITDGVTQVGQFAASTPPNTYHTLPNGGRYGNLTMTLSAADNVTVYFRAA